MANIQIRLPEDVKLDAEAIFSDMGISISEAIRLFLKQSINCGGLPFQPRTRQITEETRLSFKEAEDNLEGLKKYHGVDAMFKDLGLEED
jgi:DNA-damage-inducible protein J